MILKKSILNLQTTITLLVCGVIAILLLVTDILINERVEKIYSY